MGRSMRYNGNFSLVTDGRWHVSGCMESGKPGVTLGLFRTDTPSGRFFDHPEYDGKWFATEQEKDRWLIDHGFLREHRYGWCRKHRKQHYFCGGKTGDCAEVTHPYPGCAEAQESFDAEAPAIHADRRAQNRCIAALKTANAIGWYEAYKLLYEVVTPWPTPERMKQQLTAGRYSEQAA